MNRTKFYEVTIKDNFDVAYAAIAGTAGTNGRLGWNVFVNGVTGAADTATKNFASGKMTASSRAA